MDALYFVMKFWRAKKTIMKQFHIPYLLKNTLKRKAFQLKFSHFSNANIPVELPFHAFTFFSWIKQIAGNKKKLRVPRHKLRFWARLYKILSTSTQNADLLDKVLCRIDNISAM